MVNTLMLHMKKKNHVSSIHTNTHTRTQIFSNILMSFLTHHSSESGQKKMMSWKCPDFYKSVCKFWEQIASDWLVSGNRSELLQLMYILFAILIDLNCRRDAGFSFMSRNAHRTLASGDLFPLFLFSIDVSLKTRQSGVHVPLSCINDG